MVDNKVENTRFVIQQYSRKNKFNIHIQVFVICVFIKSIT